MADYLLTYHRLRPTPASRGEVEVLLDVVLRGNRRGGPASSHTWTVPEVLTRVDAAGAAVVPDAALGLDLTIERL